MAKFFEVADSLITREEDVDGRGEEDGRGDEGVGDGEDEDGRGVGDGMGGEGEGRRGEGGRVVEDDAEVGRWDGDGGEVDGASGDVRGAMVLEGEGVEQEHEKSTATEVVGQEDAERWCSKTSKVDSTRGRQFLVASLPSSIGRVRVVMSLV